MEEDMIKITIPDSYKGSCSLCHKDMWKVPSHQISVTYSEPIIMSYGPDIEGHTMFVCDSCVTRFPDQPDSDTYEVVKSFTGEE